MFFFFDVEPVVDVVQLVPKLVRLQLVLSLLQMVKNDYKPTNFVDINLISETSVLERFMSTKLRYKFCIS